MERPAHPLPFLRLGWICSHLFWAAALAISVNVGRRAAQADSMLAELCDDMFSNGDNGPFGYGANAAASNAIDRLLLAGCAVAIALTIFSWRRRAYRLVTANVLIGVFGGGYAAVSYVAQSDSNPYCPVDAWHTPFGIAIGLLVAAILLNIALDRPVESTPSSSVNGNFVAEDI